MLPRTFALALLGVAVLLASPARGDDPTPGPSLEIGETLPAFQAPDLDGRVFDFGKARSAGAEEALAAVAEAAKACGATGVTRETALDAIPGLAKDGAADAEARRTFAGAVGRPFGLVPDPEKVAAWKTAGDAAAWVEGAAKAPIVFVAWSSGCPTCRMYEERLAAAASSTGSRVYLLACNWNDPDEAIRAAVTERKLPFPVLIDRDQKVTGVLGGRKTPHVFVLDATNTLRYAGAIDNDAALQGDPAKRAEWMKDALAALAEGRSSFDVLLTTPKG
jgi:thiol-disulfide isomerase/thioredoxin